MLSEEAVISGAQTVGVLYCFPCILISLLHSQTGELRPQKYITCQQEESSLTSRKASQTDNFLKLFLFMLVYLVGYPFYLDIPRRSKLMTDLTGSDSIQQLFSFKDLTFKGWQNGPASKRACHQAWKPEFSSRNS